jgi:prevent-host-death family protein
MSQVELEEAKEQLTELIEKAAKGEEIVITRDRLPVARLVAVSGKRDRQFGSAKGLIEMADDFDAPVDDFSDYM